MLNKLKFLKHIADLNKKNDMKNLLKNIKSLIRLKTKMFVSFASTKTKVLSYFNYIPNENESLFWKTDFFFKFHNIKCP